ncbi:N-acetylmuramoyl-L-alanine amidase [Jiella sp. M17.18]|uniref:N-acetylmuramoyl-L-alanine amidase n=1 Tax=Jiella sp. M17.18 TaxID=3234247 RepID=UPI0034DE6E0C
MAEGFHLEALLSPIIDFVRLAGRLGTRRIRRLAPRAAIGACLLAAALVLARPPAAFAGEHVITSFDQTATEAGLNVSFTLNGAAPVRLLQLHNPERIALDFDDTLPAVSIPEASDNPLVETIRHGLVSSNRYRVIFRLKSPGAARLEQHKTPGGEVVALSIAPPGSIEARKAGAPAAKGVQPKTGPGAAAVKADAQAVSEKPAAPRQLVIVVDPGHGGIDEGAKSPSGTLEKDVNLAMALAVRDALSAYPGIKVVLTRDDDTYIPLDERSAIARRAHANLFISIHADSIRYKDLRGATVYTLSDKASDELSRQIAASENAVDRFAGPEWHQSQPEVFDILLDLTRRETVSFSEHFAASLVHDLQSDKIDLINRPKRSAAFVVLKAPDVPSVLVECGFLSNAGDEKLLKDSDWRKKMGGAIADAVVAFFRGKGATLTAAGQ